MDARRCPDGTWIVFHDRFSRRPSRVPTLSQVLSFCRSRRAPVFLDVKESRREKELLAVVRRSGWLSRTVILTYSLPSLRRWRRLLPAGHPLFWVTGARAPLTSRRVSLACSIPVRGVVAYRKWVVPASVRRAHKAGLEVLVWTARTAGEIRRLMRANVDGIMSEVWPPPRLT